MSLISCCQLTGQLRIMALGVLLLEGKDISDDVLSIGQSLSLNPSKLGKLSSAAASLLWYSIAQLYTSNSIFD